MFVAASTRCFPNLPVNACLAKLADLEYSAAEIVVGGGPGDLNPELVISDVTAAARLILCCRQVSPVTFFLDIPTDDPRYFEKFLACVNLSKLVKVVRIAVLSAPLGTPYNEEIERLRRMVQIGVANGIIVSVLTQSGCITESVDSIQSLCRSVPSLTIALDPSWFIFGRTKQIDFEPIVPFASHVRLRDTTNSKFQVQIGQGILEYSRLIIQLNKARYDHALCVDLAPLPNIDQESELRKMRLLMESVL